MGAWADVRELSKAVRSAEPSVSTTLPLELVTSASHALKELSQHIHVSSLRPEGTDREVGICRPRGSCVQAGRQGLSCQPAWTQEHLGPPRSVTRPSDNGTTRHTSGDARSRLRQDEVASSRTPRSVRGVGLIKAGGLAERHAWYTLLTDRQLPHPLSWSRSCTVAPGPGPEAGPNCLSVVVRHAFWAGAERMRTAKSRAANRGWPDRCSTDWASKAPRRRRRGAVAIRATPQPHRRSCLRSAFSATEVIELSPQTRTFLVRSECPRPPPVA